MVRFLVIPAEAGIQRFQETSAEALVSRLRGNDGGGASAGMTEVAPPPE